MAKKTLIALLFTIFISFISCNNISTNKTNVSTVFSNTTLKSTNIQTTQTKSSYLSTTSDNEYLYNPISVEPYVLEEARISFKFFYEAFNGDKNSAGYGMITDRYNVIDDTLGAASIASVGFGLSALIIGIENDWISYEEAKERASLTLNTLLSMQRTHGFFYHFVNMNNAKRAGFSEVSIIDTALLIAGCIVVGEYFGGEIKSLAETIADSVEWDWYYNWNRMCFYMGYLPESGFSYYWDAYAEQLIMYVLAAGSKDFQVKKEAYYHMKNLASKNSYGSSDVFYHSPAGTLFTYQFSHAWIDFRNIIDKDGTNWFENSLQATIAAYDYGLNQSQIYKTFSQFSWGLTASDGPDGYKGNYGNYPSNNNSNYNDGTIAPCGAIGSIVFTPELVIPTIEHYSQIDQLQSKYGFKDSYNLGLTLEADPFVTQPKAEIPKNGWYNEWVIGIDKGISLLMIENYRSGLIWHYFMQNESVQRGLIELEFVFN